MPMYEHVFLARQDLAQAQVDALGEQFGKIIADGQGTVTKTEAWGLRTIAYKIKKNRKAHYVLLNIDAPPPAIFELERQVALNEDVIRYQTIRVDALDPEPAALMRKSDRADRPERGERGGRGGGGGFKPDRSPRADRDREEYRAGDLRSGMGE